MHGVEAAAAAASEPMKLTFEDGAAAGQVITMERRPTGPPHRLHVVVRRGVARVAENGREHGAVLYRRDLATDAGASYRLAHPLLSQRETGPGYGGVDEDVTFERPAP